MQDTPKGNRIHVAFFGKRNAGKSSIINAFANQQVSIVSNIAGTTTDPVYKAMELFPIGPIMLIDTAGLDDEGYIGNLRIEKTKEIMDKTDIAVIVMDCKNKDFQYEMYLKEELGKRKIPMVITLNKIDESDNLEEAISRAKEQLDNNIVPISALQKENIDKLKEKIIEQIPSNNETTLLEGIVEKKDLVLLITPQDLQAPKGRLILPQVQVLRDILDKGAMAMVLKDTELKEGLKNLYKKPDLVITDSQIFNKVKDMIPIDIKLTSFSILMARYKGDIKLLIEGAKSISSLKPGDNILISEACTHHPLKGDIAKEKIPKLLKKKIGGEINIDFSSGGDFTKNIEKYKLIIHCGGCMLNKKQMVNRLNKAREKNIPITNFGVVLAYLNGILDRVSEIF
ncbi:[FeFe] hydrogenase H-cluster maturation GTPase HydF [Clostridium cochlearium]|uniref:[FeFe] hydrogenase H-cluster maturation GTPase HydF n=1 Tax=Clostridium cochlearium TaxID=1494 RepID=UPI001C0ED293|nr:[FeFe] hydrogenase H-cluster maturation GTPase HydF [Clostridium cochlearium]MBU5268823.1 [FeFe] hydrogenase H-cluster maturation GTPase HydF [Clostridium cochlearium]MBV1819394.1 [FeFe] hydrogenase H-cluster maturation GTPase HydF [Bacteroidales bacterium MSK.15.36]MCG4570895.1 [FeFe] hydrogenase H-cluster maturation GTPase HydF [Clostridium cochlearium]MCG4579874.1 [FeFe] hydrogenase H-cluster maturation GTPase HydF [Clostridium cochlearium]